MQHPALKVCYGLESHPLRIGHIAMPCFILNNKQAVLLRSGVQKALGYDGRSEKWLMDIVTHIHKFVPVVSLVAAAENPIVFEIVSPDGIIHTSEGISPETFLDLCEVLVTAKKEGYLSVSQLKFSKTAAVLLDTLSETNFNELIEESTGLKFFRERSIEHLQTFLWELFNDDAVLWTRTFPHDFFLALFEIHGSEWTDMDNHPQHMGKIVHEVVFSRIPDDLMETLRLKKPLRSYKRQRNRRQDLEHPELKIYISNILSLFQAAGRNWNIFLQLLNRSYPKNTNFVSTFPLVPDPALKKEDMSSFNKNLIKMS
jgi:P63C domain-containing protein